MVLQGSYDATRDESALIGLSGAGDPRFSAVIRLHSVSLGMHSWSSLCLSVRLCLVSRGGCLYPKWLPPVGAIRAHKDIVRTPPHPSPRRATLRPHPTLTKRMY